MMIITVNDLELAEQSIWCQKIKDGMLTDAQLNELDDALSERLHTLKLSRIGVNTDDAGILTISIDSSHINRGVLHGDKIEDLKTVAEVLNYLLNGAIHKHRECIEVETDYDRGVMDERKRWEAKRCETCLWRYGTCRNETINNFHPMNDSDYWFDPPSNFSCSNHQPKEIG